LVQAEERARAYAGAFPDVVGYRLGSRWYGIALGPYSPEGAAARMAGLKRENLIPRDSFLSDGTNFRDKFWPVAGEAPVPDAGAMPALSEVVAPASEPMPEPIAAPEAPLLEESPAQARRSEGLLSRAEREDLQRALAFDGFYTAGIDGAFGSGTRKSMAAWQTAMGFAATGILTTSQRTLLVANWRANLAEFGFETVTEAEAGIEISLPLGLVAFDHYEPPFVHFNSINPDGMRVILISQPGDRAALYGLYDILQTLAIIPPEGERSRNERSFQINAANGSIASFAHAELAQGLVKGYILVWPLAEADRAGRVLTAMRSSFRPYGNRALDPGMVAMTDAARRGLLAGLEVRRPKLSRSGFYIDGMGRVVTTLEAVAECGRITLDSVTEATVTFSDAASGLAVLTPAQRLSPMVVAELQTAPDRIGAAVAVAGYSYGDTLPAPVMTYGTLEDIAGLDGQTGIKRLGIGTLPGDAGGPVIDSTGAVLGMLRPANASSARVLPEGVGFATSSAVIAEVLARAGIAVTQAPPGGALAPEDLTRRAMGMTVLVSCWD
jgi:peptidoglycan hydrolase-like protein with peptidoglycan-binding domain/S1-C subfamily serine protease